ncbi:hypothetical protein L9F63_016684 [Diploptera punctata]|uniref:Ionotropic glutamate receptor C-terminal domain-containing protein n=1 Tax=Diploptera punctata TaxID=6984 RepID=A0AAD8A074_DIPPU|nr:hypothetical protein L9F63_016684 [Diploptera punctata]
MQALFILYLPVSVMFQFANCNLDLLPEVHRQAVYCIKQIIAQYFEENVPLAISDPRNTYVETTGRKLVNTTLRSDDVLISDVIIRELTNGSSRPTVVWHQKHQEEADAILTSFPIERLNFIFILSDYQGDIYESLSEFTEILQYLYVFQVFYCCFPKVIIALPEIPKTIRQNIYNWLQEYLFAASMYNVVLISPKHVASDDRSELTHQMSSDIYTWFPFPKHQNCGESRNLLLIDRWNSQENGQFEQNTDLFPRKISKKFNGCSIKYVLNTNSSASWELEWFLLRTVFESLNITHLEETQDNKLDIVLTRSFGFINMSDIEDSNHMTTLSNYKTSFPHLFSRLRCYVPCPKRTVRHGNFYKVFAPGVWLLFFITCILMTVIIILLQRTRKSESFNNLSYSHYYIWAVVTSVSVPQMPTTSKLRIFFFMWVCYCLIMSTVFQSFFTSFLIEPGTEEQINTFEELLNTDFEILTDSGTIFHFFVYFGFRYKVNEIGHKFRLPKFPIEEFFTHERSAVIASDLDMKLKFPRYWAWIKPYYFYFSVDYSMTFLYFNPFSPYYEAFNSRIVQFHEAGLFTKHIDDFISSKSESVLNVTVLESKLENETTEKYFIFNMKHMKVVFILYLFGNILSVVVFTAEVVLGKK